MFERQIKIYLEETKKYVKEATESDMKETAIQMENVCYVS